MEPIDQNSAAPARKKALVFMPEGGWNEEYYKQLIQPTLEEAAYSSEICKNVYSNCDPLIEILEPIRNSQVVVIWIDGRDPGALYALGIAQTLSVKTVLIVNSVSLSDIPIGLRPTDWIEINQLNPFWGSNLRSRLNWLLTNLITKN